jgi:soluble lytic murein transglycosylase-like protein
LKPEEWSALKNTASKLKINWEPLYKMIMFESRWNPQAKNPSSGARGLIQWTPSTAKGMGYKGSIGIFTLLLLAGTGYFVAKKLRLL